MKIILIAGATGFIGKSLVKYLLNQGYHVHALTRKNKTEEHPNLKWFSWNPLTGTLDPEALKDVEVIINLIGTSIAEKRWTRTRKKILLNSRVKPIDLLFKAIKAQVNKNGHTTIKTFISSSAVGYYGAVTSSKIYQETDSPGNDFLASICVQWENAAKQIATLGIKTYILRKGIILGKQGGMYKKMAPLAKWGINIALGNGKQYLPWINLSILLQLYKTIIENETQAKAAHKTLEAVSENPTIFNVVSASHMTMNQFSSKLLAAFGKKSYLPNIPAFIIKVALGEMSVMLLEGSRVSNEKVSKQYPFLAWNHTQLF
ncbi:MAG: TIGR01777 family protein [Pedobacter sp.]|nr:MAG: TIGR01777 family protein [Pedobacter sp.]